MLAVPDRHLRVNVIAPVTKAGAVQFRTYRQALTAALVITFLGQLLRGARRKVLLIVDRLQAPEAAAVQEWGTPRRDQLVLCSLPRRSPELNPEESLNNEVKGSVTAEGRPHNRGELPGRLEAFLHKLGQLPDHVMSYFQHPCTQYAAAMDV